MEHGVHIYSSIQLLVQVCSTSSVFYNDFKCIFDR